MIRLAKTSHNLHKWTPADKEKVRDLFFEGYSDSEIGEKISRTAKAVSVVRHYLGLHKKRQPSREFRIHDAMADYYPTWYKKHLLQQWKEK